MTLPQSPKGNPSDKFEKDIEKLLLSETYGHVPNDAFVPRECDLVLKGGITSGVVYPLAICQIATKYRLKQLGGTSAGAIAAAMAAAAEVGRSTVGGGFPILAGIPDDITELDVFGRTKLMRLFQPRKNLQRLFDTLLKLMNLSSYWQLPKPKNLLERLAFPLMRMEMTFTSVFAMLSSWVFAYLQNWVILLVVSFCTITIAYLPLDLIGKIVWVPLTTAIVTLVFIAIDFFVQLPREHFGMCGGGSQANEKEEALCDWLHRNLNTAAFGTSGATRANPLTFGELWSGEMEANRFIKEEARKVDLQLLTTCVSHGRSYKLPLTDINLDLYFTREDLRRVVSENVVTWLVELASETPTSVKELGNRTYYPMPSIVKWPVVLAVRMSLSFPILFSMVRFYTRDSSDAFSAVWFTDGGLASNFPIHLFDDPIPRRPTFAINLRGLHEGETLTPDDAQNVETWVPDPSTGVKPLPITPVPNIPSFFGRLLDTMQNWSDNSLTNVIGYRDRIVHVKLAADEGGMNLNMDPETINRLRNRGLAAGLRLVAQFSDPATSVWKAHRRDRIAIAVCGAQKWIKTLATDYDENAISAELTSGDNPFEESHIQSAMKGLSALIATNNDWENSPFATWLYNVEEIQKIAALNMPVGARLELRNRTS